MANYCTNYVTLYGNQEDLKTIDERFSRYSEFDYFTNFCEMVLGKPISEDNFDGYQYGTKWWELDIVDLGDGSLNIQGCSAWNPPLQLIAEITKVFNVRAEGDYYESGNNFAGIYVAKDGVLNDNEMTCFEYDLTEDRGYTIERLIADINDGTISHDYAKDKCKQLLTEGEWNQVLTETKNK